MSRWAAVVFAVAGPGDDEMASRLSTYLHPLAGRPLAYHTLEGLSQLDPPPRRIVVAGRRDLHSDHFGGIRGGVEVLDPGSEAVREAVGGAGADELVFADAAAATGAPAFARLLEGEPGVVVRGADEAIGAVRGRTADLLPLLDDPEPLVAAARLEGFRTIRARELHVVRDRAALARAIAACRDRLVERLMRQGVTFLLPGSVLLDVDVKIGRDSVVYPHVVIEGATTIGSETVVGPGCRILESWIGSGVELKGWNYISHTSVRNRAILEPYVRRGYD